MGGGGILCYQPVHHPASVWTLGCGLQDAVQERYENNDVSVPGHRDVPSYGGKELDSGFVGLRAAKGGSEVGLGSVD